MQQVVVLDLVSINKREPAHCPNNCETKTDSTGWKPLTRATNKWQPTCKCETTKRVPAVVLDPFGGSGTTALVSGKLKRNWIVIDLSEEYCEMGRQRLIEAKYGVKSTKQTNQPKGLFDWNELDLEIK